jgi:hypothetical protein
MIDDRHVDRMPVCRFCGGPEHIDFADIWLDHTFTLQTCCEQSYESLVAEMNDDPAWARALLQHLGVETITGHRLRRLSDDGGARMLLDYKLNLRPIAFRAAQNFIGRFHRHCGPPVASRFRTSCWNGGTMVGVVTIGNPVAPALCGRGIVEVNRLCIRTDIAPALAFNAASKLYGWAAREARRRGWREIITYTRAEDERGTSLIAAGWEQRARVRGRGWHSARRSRSNRNGFFDKIRWGKSLEPIAPARRTTAAAFRDESAAMRTTRWLGDTAAATRADPLLSIG